MSRKHKQRYPNTRVFGTVALVDNLTKKETLYDIDYVHEGGPDDASALLTKRLRPMGGYAKQVTMLPTRNSPSGMHMVVVKGPGNKTLHLPAAQAAPPAEPSGDTTDASEKPSPPFIRRTVQEIQLKEW